MSSITDEHTDELKARRQRRQAGQAPPATNGETASSAQSADAARDLLRGLITDGAQHNEEAPAARDTDRGDEPRTSAREQNSYCDPRGAAGGAKARREGEEIDELIRRVKESMLGAAADASSTIQQRRPKGTADLSPDAAAPRRRGARRRVLATNKPPRSEAASKRTTRRWGATAAVLVAGIAGLLITLSAGGHAAPGAVDTSASSARLPAARPEAFGGALHAAIAAIAPGLQAIARRAAEAANAARARQRARRPHSRLHTSATRPRNQTPPVQSRTVAESSPPPTTAPQTQTSTPAPTPARSTYETPATPQTSATSSSQPAGPAGSDPLGGIGACVKGC